MAGSAPAIARCFAIAGMFWLTILLGLALTDPLTRAVCVVVLWASDAKPSGSSYTHEHRAPGEPTPPQLH